MMPWIRGIKYWGILHLVPGQVRRRRVRAALARTFLRGDGLEIGALHMPIRMPRGASVRYVDYHSTDELRELYPELGSLRLAPVDIVDDGETLRTVPERSADFIVANHMIEHCENPIGTIARWLEILRTGGILYLAVPDPRRTFDRGRPLTRLEHLLRDYREGPASSRREHLEDYALRWRVPEAKREQWIEEMTGKHWRLHYHCWSPKSFREMLECCRSDLGLPIRLEALREVHNEFIAVARKV